mmetsp:Transcript_135/g.401  ORF Transcript_135/g.401 Transcript_135/m.401 type:complete len:161 (+) Transcript_135:1442-1924(+)
MADAAIFSICGAVALPLLARAEERTVNVNEDVLPEGTGLNFELFVAVIPWLMDPAVRISTPARAGEDPPAAAAAAAFLELPGADAARIGCNSCRVFEVLERANGDVCWSGLSLSAINCDWCDLLQPGAVMTLGGLNTRLVAMEVLKLAPEPLKYWWILHA